MQTVSDIFFAHLCEFHRLALALCGDCAMAERAIIDAYDRAADADYVRPGWHLRWIKHCLIKSCLESMKALKAKDPNDVLHASRWSDFLSSPFCTTLPRVVFVLRIWEKIPLIDVGRYCSLSYACAQDTLLQTWKQVRLRPECLAEFVAALARVQ